MATLRLQRIITNLDGEPEIAGSVLVNWATVQFAGPRVSGPGTYIQFTPEWSLWVTASIEEIEAALVEAGELSVSGVTIGRALLTDPVPGPGLWLESDGQ